MAERRCPKCGSIKPMSEFYKEASRRDGVRYWCKVCERALAKARYEAEPEKYRARQQTYRAANREQIRARQRAFRDANPEQVRAWRKAHRATDQEKQRAWAKAHPEKRCAAQARRRARKNGAAGYANAELRAARWDYYGGLCYICGGEAEAMDHVKPLDKGGSNWPANLRPICTHCNCAKGAKWPHDFEGVLLEEQS